MSGIHTDIIILKTFLKANKYVECIIDVIDVPMRPEGPLEVSEVTDSGVQLRWYPPQDAGGGPIIGYIIDARELGNIDIIR